MVKESKTILKIDLDMSSKLEVIKVLTYRLIFLQDLKLLKLTDINFIELVKKKKYSVKIGLKNQLKEPIYIIIFQAILGTDIKHTGVCFRDYLLGIENFSRCFDVKRYPNGKIIYAKKEDITERVLLNIKKKNGSN